MAEYVYADKPLNNDLFREQLAGLPGATFRRAAVDADTWQIVVTTPSDLTAPQQAALAALVAAHDYTQRTAAQQSADQAKADIATAKNQAVTIAQSAVGVGIGALTAPQVRALVACLLWKNGALNPNGTVRALSDWL